MANYCNIFIYFTFSRTCFIFFRILLFGNLPEHIFLKFLYYFLSWQEAQFSFEYIYFILHFPEHSRAIYFDFRTVLFLKCLKAQFSFEKIWLMLQKEKNKTSSQQSVYAAGRLAIELVPTYLYSKRMFLLVVEVIFSSLSAKSSTFRVFSHLGKSFNLLVVSLACNFPNFEYNFRLVLNQPIIIQRILFCIRNCLIHVKHSYDSKFLASKCI